MMYFSKDVSGQFDIRPSKISRFVLWNAKEFNIVFERSSVFSDVAADAFIVKKEKKLGPLSCEVYWTDSIPADYKVVTAHHSKRP
jgi:hypothetical protein